MTTETSICNLALAHLGDEATVASIDPPEGSAQAQHCATFYPIARDALQEMHDWSFCTTRKALALVSGTPISGWELIYGRPSNAVKILSLFEAGSLDDTNPQPFDTESLNDGTEVILSNTPSAVCRYIFQVTDPSKFSPLFVEGLAWLLAAHLAGPVLKGETGRIAAQTCLGQAQSYINMAKESDSRQRRVIPVQNVAWIAGR